MNRPNFASRNHAIFSSCDAGAGSGGGSFVMAGGGACLMCLVQQQPPAKTATSDRKSSSAKDWGSLAFMVCVRKVLIQIAMETNRETSKYAESVKEISPGLHAQRKSRSE